MPDVLHLLKQSLRGTNPQYTMWHTPKFIYVNTLGVIALSIMAIVHRDYMLPLNIAYGIGNSVLYAMLFYVSLATPTIGYVSRHIPTRDTVNEADLMHWISLVHIEKDQRVFRNLSKIGSFFNGLGMGIMTVYGLYHLSTVKGFENQTLLEAFNQHFFLETYVHAIFFQCGLTLMRKHIIPTYFNNQCAFYTMKADVLLQLKVEELKQGKEDSNA